MKAYTDLEQSKKLAEILPLESADMNWHEIPSIGLFARAFPYKHDDGATEGVFPCWSLAALLNVLNDDYYTTLYHDGVAWNITAIHHDNVKDKHNVYANTPVDACVEMILKLHELNLL